MTCWHVADVESRLSSIRVNDNSGNHAVEESDDTISDCDDDQMLYDDVADHDMSADSDLKASSISTPSRSPITCDATACRCEDGLCGFWTEILERTHPRANSSADHLPQAASVPSLSAATSPSHLQLRSRHRDRKRQAVLLRRRWTVKNKADWIVKALAAGHVFPASAVPPAALAALRAAPQQSLASA